MNQSSFLMQALVYLAAAVVMVPVAKKLGLGAVLGYLLAGVLIGPAVMGFIGQEGADIMHFAEFGVVMMLFIIGLELEPDVLWALRKAILELGILQVLLTSAVIFTLALLSGMPWRPSLAVSMILSLSSTAIVLQSLQEKDLMKSDAGQSAFAVLLFQDIAVIPMLALFPLLSAYNGGGNSAADPGSWINRLPRWEQALVTFGSVVSIIIAGRYIVKPVLRIVAATRLREMFTATSLLLVVGIAVLMSQVGLSPALGTFLAGVVLANSEFKHELESDIEPFKGLLLGLFFIAVGASINFSLIAEKPWTILGLVAGLMIVKTIVLLALGKIFRLRTDQNLLFSLSLSQVGEFSFVLFSFCVQENILAQPVADSLVAVVAISMTLTPVLMLLNEKVLQPRLGTTPAPEQPEADIIDETNPVIIAGFGHFGTTTGRFLRANKISTTILDVDSDRVDTLRKMGFKVYYGDASRYDLLKSAGADKARLIIIAIDNADKRLEMIETIKKHFPNLHMLVRATNRIDAYAQMNAGMLHVYRETVDTALRVGVDAMKFLGYRAYSARKAAIKFFKMDEHNLKKLAAIREPDQYINTARELIEELEKIIQSDAQVRNLGGDINPDNTQSNFLQQEQQ